MEEKSLRSPSAARGQPWHVVALTLCWWCPALADVAEDADSREAIVLACHYEMGEFGVAAVQRCIESETSALTALSRYPEPARAIVARCERDLPQHAWESVKTCVDQDLAAEEALQRYPVQRQSSIEACRNQLGRQGAAKVKACVDRLSPAAPEAAKP